MFASLYLFFLNLDKRLKKKIKLSRPVISVGNIALGGRGKSPMTQYLALHLKKCGYQPVLLTRGYGRQSKDFVSVDYDQLGSVSVSEIGDEAYEFCLLTKSPILVHKKRSLSALNYLKKFPEQKTVFILDDGFQHWALNRDFDLVLTKSVDMSARVLPFGNLRESPTSLCRADFILEQGKDFFKKSSLMATPSRELPHYVLTTRVADALYEKELLMLLPEVSPVFLSLRDHASSKDVLAQLKELPENEFNLFLGFKEAVKVLSYQELSDIVEHGFVQKVIFSKNIYIYAVFCGVQIDQSKEELLWKAINSTLF